MASIKFSGMDDVLKNLKRMETEFDGFKCPICGKAFTLKLNANKVTCPHCHAEIEITHK